jgi:large subunit ribosomal protein L31
MKKIHPQYFEEAKISCSCGNSFVAGSTKAQINVEVCHLCHPYYTGKQKFVDTKGKIVSFERRLKEAEKYQALRSKKKEKAKSDYQAKSLKDLLSSI